MSHNEYSQQKFYDESQKCWKQKLYEDICLRAVEEEEVCKTCGKDYDKCETCECPNDAKCLVLCKIMKEEVEKKYK